MKKTTILIIVLSISLIGVCALCAITLVSSYAWLSHVPGGVRVWDVANISAQVQESRSYELTTPATLDVYTDAGSITVTSADVESIEVEMTRTAWASSEEKALATAEALPVTFNQVGSKLTIRYERPGSINLGGNRGGPDSVDFTIRVPPETAVILEAKFGEVSLTGTTGDADITCSFGDLNITNVNGAVIVHGAQSGITISKVDSGTDAVTVETSFGDVDVNGLVSGKTLIRTSNGAITINNLSSSGDVEIRDQFGDITVDEFTSGTVIINSNNGQINISSGVLSEALDITNTFGSVIVRETKAAAFELETSNGELNIDGGSGPLTLTNNFGDILVTAADKAILTAKTSNGQVSFSGSLDPNSNHIIENSFGDIHLSIPTDSAFDIKFKTQFGEINSDLPVTVSGSVSQTSLEGALNGGGSQLQATTSNGNISLKALSNK